MSSHATHAPPWYLGLALGSLGLFLGGTLDFLYPSSLASSCCTMSSCWLARFTYSQGSCSILNKQGPVSFVQSGGELGGLSQVTTAFFSVLLETFDCSYPGGGYQPFQAFPAKTKVNDATLHDETGKFVSFLFHFRF